VGGIVCTALAASGAFSTDLKIGHWIGATPARVWGEEKPVPAEA